VVVRRAEDKRILRQTIPLKSLQDLAHATVQQASACPEAGGILASLWRVRNRHRRLCVAGVVFGRGLRILALSLEKSHIEKERLTGARIQELNR
jgi:hypothetical protein